MLIDSLPVLYQDEALSVINKPHGLLSVPGRGADKYDSVASRIKAVMPSAEVVHRLDCHTSGVMIMALGKTNQVELNRQFHDRETGKHYIAIVVGKVVEDEGRCDLPMRCDIDNRPRQIIDHEHGKSALTLWQRLDGDEDTTRLLLRPITGRSHQLRVHCASMGHPVVGDSLYGDAQAQYQPRMYLHASRLEFTHPQTGERVVITADCDF